ncbi:hypothetical protein AK812_SmicGene11964 [Symbiodinium microadriaticum]|uniref:Uncharacterized protein n=1 Tax=Symbiodinium microadriaticum TaxID=2951 RepID=A0A1Q9EBT3_SYMMI|nr:hypothetical protein AK812_SmicGene11964 [Symbiodinium microadriaticum]
MAPKRMLEKGTGSVCRYGTDRAAGRDRQGIYVHTRQERIGGNRCMDNLVMLKEVLRLVRKRKHGSTPVLVLDIRRSRSRHVSGEIPAAVMAVTMYRQENRSPADSQRRGMEARRVDRGLVSLSRLVAPLLLAR